MLGVLDLSVSQPVLCKQLNYSYVFGFYTLLHRGMDKVYPHREI